MKKRRTMRGYLNHLVYIIMPEDFYLKFFYFFKMRKRINLSNPKTFNEKLCWLRKYYRHNKAHLIQICYDKYTVREYVRNKIGEKYLIPLIEHCFEVDEIEFNKLPIDYIIKISQSCGKNIIVLDNGNANHNEIKKNLNSWLKDANNKAHEVEEEAYFFNGNSSIIVEKLLKNAEGQLPNDYKFYCLNGHVELIRVAYTPINNQGERKKNFVYNTYDSNWNFLDFNIGTAHKSDPKTIIKKPINFEEMCKVAEKLSNDFPFARIDLYNIEGKIYFGEITWIPGTTWVKIEPEIWDEKLGKKLVLPKM